MHGFHQRCLRIDLSSKTSGVFTLDQSFLEETWGGKGLATRLLLDGTPAGLDPLGPENCLIIATGPVTGSTIWGSSRYGVFTKSPQTGFYSESYSGGRAPEHISAAGYDAVLLTGISDSPVWIEISPEHVWFHSAKDLWGRDCYATEDMVKACVRRTRGQDCGAVVIGPAGENLVRFALIENDYWRSAGRTGTGAVMGSKKVKALAFWGDRMRSIAEPKLLKRFVADIAKKSRNDNGARNYKKCGTSQLVDLLNEVGAFPSRYWQTGRVRHRDGINCAALHSRCAVKPRACARCLLACGRLTTLRDGPHAGLTIEGPEYETIFAFGGLCEIREIEDIVYLNDLCDRLGMDTISAGNLAGLAIEASRRSRISLKLDYGDVQGVAELLANIAAMRGHGAVLGLGIKHAAGEWDMEDLAVHVKGLEPAGYDPRVLKGMGLAYATSDRGACHLRATFYKPELSGMVDPRSVHGKASLFRTWEDRLTFFDMLILCRFYRDMYQWEELRTICRAVTGQNLDENAMIRLASNVANDTRRFNIREGLRREDDRLPVRLTSRPLPETGHAISDREVEAMVDEYYAERGWEGRNGVPRERDATQ